ncbi:hypothetical protein BSFA1_85800 (plasmid) [Burkholderia sp. SFA1]|nr:hypothetical protein BSFA1_85800 [Burkholderia sp. SFA1]
MKYAAYFFDRKCDHKPNRPTCVYFTFVDTLASAIDRNRRAPGKLAASHAGCFSILARRIRAAE